MKNFNILGVQWKIWLSGVVSQKPNIEGGLPKRGWGWGMGEFADLKGLARKRGMVFLRWYLLIESFVLIVLYGIYGISLYRLVSIKYQLKIIR